MFFRISWVQIYTYPFPSFFKSSGKRKHPLSRIFFIQIPFTLFSVISSSNHRQVFKSVMHAGSFTALNTAFYLMASCLLLPTTLVAVMMLSTLSSLKQVQVNTCPVPSTSILNPLSLTRCALVLTAVFSTLIS